MAYLVFNDGKSATIDKEQSHKIWLVLNGEAEPDNESQELFCNRIKNIYLNYKASDTPKSYISKNIESIAYMEVIHWSVDPDGKVARPSNDADWKYAKNNGLWYMGSPTEVAKQAISKIKAKRR
jgi:hypothetical protein